MIRMTPWEVDSESSKMSALFLCIYLDIEVRPSDKL